MSTEHAAKLHFSSAHSNYYSTINFDSAYEQCEKYPDLTQETSTKTKRATKSRINYKKTNTKCLKNKRKLTLSEVFNITRTKHIKTKCELYALAETQRKEGKTDLYDFIITEESTETTDSITITLELQSAPSDLHYLQK